MVPSENSIHDSRLTAALEYARLGYAVLPLMPGEKRPHTGLVPRGLREASREVVTLEGWWRQAPEAGVGILPGAGVLVLDIDSEEAWEGLTAEYPELLRAPRQRTPRGRHVFLRLPEGAELPASTARLRGVDIRGLGRAYVVAAPTRLPGGEYAWEEPLVAEAELPPVPGDLLVRLLPEPALPPELHPARLRGLAQGARAQQLEELLHWAAEQVAAAPVGMRHTTLLRYARLVGGHVHLGLDPAHAAQVLAEAGMRAGLPPSEAEATARDGLRYGQAAPIEERGQARRGARTSATQRLVELAVGRAALWHDPEGRGWGTIEVGGHREHWPIRSRQFRLWLNRLLYEEEGEKVPNGQGLADALSAIEAQAVFAGETHPTYLRVAHLPGVVWLDLGQPDWAAVRVTADGWELVADPPVRFRRSRTMEPLPVPERGAGAAALREVLAPWALDEGQYALLVGWLLGTLGPGPYPVLALTGEQGSGKSTLARRLQALVDPSGDLATVPRNARDLFIAAQNNWVLAFDNLSMIPPWLSDDFCRLSTGGVLRTRELYTDGDEVVFRARRPVLLTGITDYVERPDLLDRSIALRLRPLPGHQPEGALQRAFEALRPLALGGLLDLVSLALRELPNTRAPNVRMADFAHWVAAAERGFARTGTFVRAFGEAHQEAAQSHLEEDPVFPVLLELLQQGPFEGTAGELLARLNEHRGEGRPPAGWPGGPRAMVGWLQRNAPVLRRAGVQAAPLPRTNARRGWVLSLDEKTGGDRHDRHDRHSPVQDEENAVTVSARDPERPSPQPSQPSPDPEEEEGEWL